MAPSPITKVRAPRAKRKSKAAGQKLLTFPVDYELREDVWFPRRSQPALSEFAYSDGDQTETSIHEIVSNAKDRSLFSQELFEAIHDWPSRYHLSSARANLLRPFQRLFRSRVLEVGAGCGALTRFLGECGGAILAVEASPRRARIARARTSNLKNVSVVCERIEEFAGEEGFDVVVVVGVLEYARALGLDGNHPEQAFLNTMSRFLTDDGVLILAIENQLGLKYFCGAPEDHLGIPYAGINDSYTPRSAVTFGLGELQRLLTASGLINQRCFLPLPDYKLPISIISQAGLDEPIFDAEACVVQSVIADAQLPKSFPFSLEQAWSLTVRNRMVQPLTNSFLIVAGRNADSVATAAAPSCLAWHYSVDRHPRFAKETLFLKRNSDVVIVKKRLCKVARPKVPLNHTFDKGPYIKGANYWLELISVANRPGWSARDIAEWSRKWLNLVVHKSGIKVLDNRSFFDLVSGDLLDAIPINCVQDTTGRLQLIDQEWRLQSSLELGYILFRGLRDSILRVTSWAEPAPGTPISMNGLIVAVFSELDVKVASSDIDRFARVEKRIERWVAGQSDEQVDSQAIGNSCDQPLNIRDGSAAGHAEGAISFREFEADWSVVQERSAKLRDLAVELNSESERIRAEVHTLTLPRSFESNRRPVQEQSSELKDKAAALNSELERTRAEHTLTLATLKEVSAQRDSVQQRNVELDDVVTSLRSELEHTRAEHALSLASLVGLNSEIERSLGENALAFSSLQEVEAQRNVLQQRNAELEHIVVGIGSELNGKRAEHELTLASLEEIKAQQNAVEKQNEELENRVTGLASELKGIRAEHELTLASQEEIKAQRNAVEKQSEELENLVAGLASELEDQRAEHALTFKSLQEVEAQWNAVQQLLERREMEYQGVIESTSWRIMAPLRKLGERAPWLARNGRRLRKSP